MFRHKAVNILCLVTLIFSVVTTIAFDVSDAYAQSGGNSSESISGAYGDVDSRCKQIRQEVASSDKDGVWLSEYIVTCVRTVITEVFSKFLLGIYEIFEDIVPIVMTLAVVFFGAGLAIGAVEKTSRDTFILLFKLASVAYFVQVPTVQWVYDSGMTAMDELTGAVFQFGKGAGSDRCIDNDTLWDRVDCMLDVLIGIKKEEGVVNRGGAGSEETGISRGLLHFFFSNMASSGVGFVIGLLGLYTMFTFVMALIKTIHTYLAAIIGMAFILMLTPLFVPMLLFKQTKNYFDKWYRIAVSFVLQPVILFGFLSLMLIAFDNVLVTGQHSLLNIATGGQCQGQMISRCYEDNDIFTTTNMSQTNLVAEPERAAEIKTERAEGVTPFPASEMFTEEMGQEVVQRLYKTSRSFESINYEKLAGLMNANDESEAKQRLVYASITLALTTFAFITMLNYIPVMAQDLAGGVFEVPNLYEKVGSNIIGGDQAQMLARNASRNIRGAIDPDNIGQRLSQFSGMVGRR